MKAAKKNTQLQIRLTHGQKRAIQRRARSEKRTVSEWVLLRLGSAEGEPFQSLLADLASADNDHPAWAAFLDWLEALPARDFERSLPEPEIHLSPLQMNLVAATVEFAAQRKGIRPPAWTDHVEPLEQPWFATNLVSLHPYLMVHAPAAFRRRNLFLDASVGARV